MAVNKHIYFSDEANQNLIRESKATGVPMSRLVSRQWENLEKSNPEAMHTLTSAWVTAYRKVMVSKGVRTGYNWFTSEMRKAGELPPIFENVANTIGELVDAGYSLDEILGIMNALIDQRYRADHDASGASNQTYGSNFIDEQTAAAFQKANSNGDIVLARFYGDRLAKSGANLAELVQQPTQEKSGLADLLKMASDGDSDAIEYLKILAKDAARNK